MKTNLITLKKALRKMRKASLSGGYWLNRFCIQFCKHRFRICLHVCTLLYIYVHKFVSASLMAVHRICPAMANVLMAVKAQARSFVYLPRRWPKKRFRELLE